MRNPITTLVVCMAALCACQGERVEAAIADAEAIGDGPSLGPTCVRDRSLDTACFAFRPTVAKATGGGCWHDAGECCYAIRCNDGTEAPAAYGCNLMPTTSGSRVVYCCSDRDDVHHQPCE